MKSKNNTEKMDVYSNPPGYDELIKQQNSERMTSENKTEENELNSEDVKTPTRCPNNNSDSTIISVQLEDDDNSRVQSPFTESLCIRMLNDESFASTNTTLTQNILDNESIIDEVFENNESEIVNTWGKGQVFESETDEKGKSENNVNKTEKDQCVKDVKLDSQVDADDDGKVIVCITEKSQIDDLLNKNKPQAAKLSTLAVPKETYRQLSEDIPKQFISTTVVITDKPKNIKTNTDKFKPKDSNVFEPPNLKFTKNGVAPFSNKQDFCDSEQRPKDYILLSCLVMWCCCSPIGVLSFIFSLFVNSSFEQGDYARSRKYSRASFWTSMLGIVFTVSLAIIFLGLFWPEKNIEILDNDHEQ